MVDATTITDEQIRELLDAGTPGDLQSQYASEALWSDVEWRRVRAREWCAKVLSGVCKCDEFAPVDAAILNARAAHTGAK